MKISIILLRFQISFLGNLVPIKNEKNNKLSEIKSLLAKTKKRQLENDNVEGTALWFLEF